MWYRSRVTTLGTGTPRLGMTISSTCSNTERAALRENAAMPPRCYLSEPGFAGSGGPAERRVWEALRYQLPGAAMVKSEGEGGPRG